ncbi:uncharacterized protein [Dermacentor albipictus]|uniref:uncharacterized protein n=1 Tax=Dermacentor albipictus TaxID=60249 RepID=UPI0038FC3A4A
MGRDVKVCTLVKRGTAFIEHELVLHEESDIDHVLIEVVPSIGSAGVVTWSNSFEDLGSDHRILSVTVGEDESEEGVCRKARIVDWDRFRKNREQNKKEGPIEDIREWCRVLLADVEKATDEVERTDWRQEPSKEEADRSRGAVGDGAPQPSRVDSRLAHLVAAKKSMQRRASRQKLKRKIRKKIAEINREIETHCARLCEQEWQELCDTMNGNMSAGQMAKLRHKYKDDPEAFAEEIVQTHLARPEGQSHPEYCGAPNEELDADFSVQEIRTVLQLLKTNSAPGPDRITNKILRNLNDDAIQKLCEYINACWKEGQIPQEWKTADVILIPKPDLKSAFDTAKHMAILDKISRLDLGARFHRYVSSFLNGREATVKIDGASPRTVRMGGAGTPQGSVLSPMLFNLVMIGLPERLDGIEGINHTIYADDVTSDILLHRPHKKGPLPQAVLDARRLGVRVTTREGTRIPTVSKLRVLGLWLEENGANRELVARLQKKVAAATQLERRVANKRKGMKEHNVTRLIQAYAQSHIAYVAAYADWNRSETDRLNVAIRRAFKTALGVLQYTPSYRLLELGVHNTLEEIAESVNLMATRNVDHHCRYKGMCETNHRYQYHHHYCSYDKNGSSNNGNIDTAGRRRRHPPSPWQS